jgi:hypothetical protein
VGSKQTLSEPERRALARGAAACVEHVLPLFEAESADDLRIHQAVVDTTSLSA